MRTIEDVAKEVLAADRSRFPFNTVLIGSELYREALDKFGCPETLRNSPILPVFSWLGATWRLDTTIEPYAYGFELFIPTKTKGEVQ